MGPRRHTVDWQQSVAQADFQSHVDEPLNPHLKIFHDDGAEVHVNGELAASLPGATGGYMFVPIARDAAKRALRPGTNTLAVYVHQERGGQFIDVGLVDVVEK